MYIRIRKYKHLQLYRKREVPLSRILNRGVKVSTDPTPQL